MISRRDRMLASARYLLCGTYHINGCRPNVSFPVTWGLVGLKERGIDSHCSGKKNGSLLRLKRFSYGPRAVRNKWFSSPNRPSLSQKHICKSSYCAILLCPKFCFWDILHREIKDVFLNVSDSLKLNFLKDFNKVERLTWSLGFHYQTGSFTSG